MDRDPCLKVVCGRAVDFRVENPFIQDDPSMSMVIAKVLLLVHLVWLDLDNLG